MGKTGISCAPQVHSKLTSNSLLIYLVSNGQQRDCYCEKVSAIEWKCGNFDYINHMIYDRSPDDFAFRLKNGNLYFFYYTFWNTVKRQDVYSGVAIKVNSCAFQMREDLKITFLLVIPLTQPKDRKQCSVNQHWKHHTNEDGGDHIVGTKPIKKQKEVD